MRRTLGRIVAAIAAAVWILLAVPGIPGWAGAAVSAHSQLVASVPGAGTVSDASPTEVRLVFSEPIEPGFSALAIVDRYAQVLVANAGTPDPADRHTLVATLASPLPDGIYSIEWHAVSAADGHATSGFFTFGIGVPVSPGTATSGSSLGDLHGGHGVATAASEVVARLLGYLGLLLAFGLLVVGRLVLLPEALAGTAGGTPDRRRERRPVAGGAAPTASRAPRAARAARAARAVRTPRTLFGGRDRGGATSGGGGGGGGSGAAAAVLDRLRQPLGLLPPAPDRAGLERTLATVQVVALVAAAFGALALAATSADSPDVDLLRFLGGTRSGTLLVARLAIGLLGATAGAILLWRGLPGAASGVAGSAALAGLVLVALGGHASAGSPATIAAMVAHLAAAAVWLSGVVALGLGALRWRDAAGGAFLRAAIPRFTALALVTVALIGFTGLILEWALVRSLVPFDTAYGIALVTKVAVFAAALAFGALNYLDGGRGRPTAVALRRRLGAEALLAIGVLVAAGNLASGSPPGAEQPVGIERAASSVAASEPIDLQLLPARPGPNRLDVVLPGGLDARSTVDLLLTRLDAGTGEARYETRRVAGAALARLSPGDHFIVDGGLLPAASRWEATAVVHGPDGNEVTRQRFVLALDAVRVAEGAARLPVEPSAVLAVVLLVLALVGLAFAVSGGVLPRAHAATGRRAVGVAGVAGAIVGLLVLVVGIGG